MKHFMKRHWKWLTGALLALSVALLFASSWRKNYDASLVLKIRHGMTEKEVEGVFGGAANSATRPIGLPYGPRPHLGVTKYWFADAGIIEVDFDDNGKVIGGGTFHSWEFSRQPNPLRRFL